MPVQDFWRDPVLINTVGHCAGILLFSAIVVLLVRGWKSHGLRRTGLSVVAAFLALGWNVGSLAVLANPSALSADIASASFCMLTILPAVLLNVALQGRHPRIVLCGYAVSLISVGMHIAETILSRAALHQAALLVVAVGFGVLALAGYFLQSKSSGDFKKPSELISLACLVLFSTSFLHFGYQHVKTPWQAEITWHHLGVPVALIVLLRDYRFLLLDTFLRFAVNFGLSVVYVALVVIASLQLKLWGAVRSNMFLMGLTLVGCCLSLIVFAHVRTVLQAWLSRVVFRRRNVANGVEEIERIGRGAQSEPELLAKAAEVIADYLRTDNCAVEPQAPFEAEASVALRFSSGETKHLAVGPRRGSQRYWSEDLADMRQLGAALVEQVERYRASELRRLVTEAELRALQAQINPHFLFNALNTLYGIIDRRSQDARRTVLNLSDIFRYFLQGHRTLIPLAEEVRIVEAYLEIEALRLGSRLESEILVSPDARQALIPILSIQPIVENAVKHGVGSRSEPCKITLTAQAEAGGVRIAVEDTGRGFEHARVRARGGTGIGLENVRKRLALSYGASATVDIQSSDSGASVSFFVPGCLRREPATAAQDSLRR